MKKNCNNFGNKIDKIYFILYISILSKLKHEEINVKIGIFGHASVLFQRDEERLKKWVLLFKGMLLLASGIPLETLKKETNLSKNSDSFFKIYSLISVYYMPVNDGPFCQRGFGKLRQYMFDSTSNRLNMWVFMKF